MVFQIQSDPPLGDLLDVMRQAHGEDFERRFNRSMRDFLDESPAKAFVGYVDGVAATAILVTEDLPVLLGLGTTPDHQKRGYAGALIDHVVDGIGPNTSIFAAVEVDGVWTRERYERRGFTLLHDDKMLGYLLLRRPSLQARNLELRAHQL